MQEKLQSLLARPGAPVFGTADRNAVRDLLTAQPKSPWYGQLMGVPQAMAYFFSLNTGWKLAGWS